jgi:hypothetical protein
MFALFLAAAFSEVIDVGRGLKKEIKKDGSGPVAAEGKQLARV